jgi:hypothetical protein
MHHLDGNSIGGSLLSIMLLWIGYITLSNVATVCAIAAAVSTIWVNVKKLKNK